MKSTHTMPFQQYPRAPEAKLRGDRNTRDRRQRSITNFFRGELPYKPSNENTIHICPLQNSTKSCSSSGVAQERTADENRVLLDLGNRPVSCGHAPITANLPTSVSCTRKLRQATIDTVFAPKADHCKDALRSIEPMLTGNAAHCIEPNASTSLLNEGHDAVNIDSVDLDTVKPHDIYKIASKRKPVKSTLVYYTSHNPIPSVALDQESLTLDATFAPTVTSTQIPHELSNDSIDFVDGTVEPESTSVGSGRSSTLNYNLSVRFTQDSQGNRIFSRLTQKEYNHES